MTLKRINQKAGKVPKKVKKAAEKAKPAHKLWIKKKIDEERKKAGE